MQNAKTPIVASLVWCLPSGIHEPQADVVQKLGYQHHFFRFDERIPSGANIVLVQGPFGTLLPVVRQLVDYPSERRPVLAYWFEESLELRWPEWIHLPLAHMFSDLFRYYHEPGWIGNSLHRIAPRFMASRGRRLCFLGDILWLRRHRLLDVLALSSTVYAENLARYGITSVLVPRGYHPDYGEVRSCQRDIAVVWMGRTRNKRRKRAVYWLRDELEKRGQTMLIYDNEENPFVFGEERTQILNRTWFVLNVFPQPTDELSIRYYVAAANGAVVLTEPGKNRYPFVPGKHLVECPVEEMPGAVMYYLKHQEEWRSISEEMLDFMKTELGLERSIATILTHAERVLGDRS